ncbi:monovalent cation/H(+) antiporter subunit G [Marivirga sp. S37H4]|uniref:Monovalent cation/H(+) antiporter subunit G n=1 Tax=Marivirga aurantiaca TaxID=2802615 RepID=A0A934WY10_9BACT|nr:monovalent cation/H(+) antiporter subunit G [Marivirga aurantiaca]MBK6264967.1 monovalent cation/H(+) antiporter subunit G [Marivirga aurantiaca]
MIVEILILIFVFLGVFLIFVATLGLFRLPDLYTRMSAVTKAVSFKVGLIMLSTAIYFNTLPVVLKSIIIVFLLLLTTPVSSHLLAREAYMKKMPLWKNTIVDEFKKYLEKKRN